MVRKGEKQNGPIKVLRILSFLTPFLHPNKRCDSHLLKLIRVMLQIVAILLAYPFSNIYTFLFFSHHFSLGCKWITHKTKLSFANCRTPPTILLSLSNLSLTFQLLCCLSGHRSATTTRRAIHAPSLSSF